MLRGHGLTRNVTVPVSAGLLTDTAAYFAALGRYRAGATAPIIERVANAAFAALANGRQLLTELRAVRAGWDDRISARQGSGAWRLADLLVRLPVIDAASVARELAIAPQNAQRIIAPLVDAGVVQEITGFARNRMWQASEVLDALDEFADRAGRRSW